MLKPFSKTRYLQHWFGCQHLYGRYRASTMIKRRPYVENLVLASLALGETDGAVVECGTWKGGMAAGLMHIGGPDRPYFFFDSFEGLPPAKPIDGAGAAVWQADTSAPAYFNNCTSTLADFEDSVSRVPRKPKRMQVVKGFFERTVPNFDTGPISVLRLDGDWYDSTMVCLQSFWDRVLPGGIILIDDYGVWEGCNKAVHDFLSARKSPEHIQQGPLGRVAYMRKR